MKKGLQKISINPTYQFFRFSAALIVLLTMSVQSLFGQWSTATLSEARQQMGATSVGDKAFFAGGVSGSGLSAVVDIYDNSTDTWSTAALSEARRLLSAASVGDKVFFAGGITAGPSSAVVDIYDNSTDTWSTATLSEARNRLCATSVGDKVFFAGGYNGTSMSSVVDIYDNGTDTWSTATLSEGRNQISATSVGDKVFFAGGYNGTSSSAVVDIYDNNTDTWSSTTLSEARSFVGATTVGNKVFFGGGYSTAESAVVDIYDNSTDVWSTATLSEARSILSATSVGNKVFFAGGYIAGAMSNVVDVYDNGTNTWSTATLSVARYELSATSVGEKVFFAGGIDASNYYDNVDIYTLTLEDKLLAHYPFTGDATDATANGNDGTLGDGVTATTFPTLGVDREATASAAYSFDGGDYIAVPHTSSFEWGTDVDVTAMCWFNTTSTTFGDLIFKETYGDYIFKEDGFKGLILALDATGTISLYGGGYLTSNTTGLNDGTWHHVAVVLDRDQGMAIYIDGVLDASNTELTNTYDFSDTRELLIGSGQDISNVKNTFFTGSIDEVRLYNYTLTQTEVEDLYTSEAVPLTAPVLTDPASNITDSSFDLDWTTTDGSEYRVEVAADAGFTTMLIDHLQAGTTYSMTGTSAATTHYARITTVDGILTSDPSNVVTITTEAGSLGLVANYRMEGDGVDATANSFTATLGDGSTTTTFPTAAADRFGTSSMALAFDGGDYLDVPHNAAFNFGTSKDLVISGWFNTTSTTTGVLFDKSDGTTGYVAFLGTDGSLTYNLVNSVGGVVSLNSNVTGLNDGNWHHFIVIVDRDGDMELYIDGTLDNNSATPSTGIDIDTTEDFLIGVSSNAGMTNLNNYFIGSLDDFRIFDELISSEQVAQLYHHGAWDVNSVGIVGTALSGATNSLQIDMQANAGGGFEKVVQFYDGEIQFNYNSNAALVYGDDEMDGTADLNGTGINVTAGYYLVRYNPNTAAYTIAAINRIGFSGSALTGSEAGWAGDDLAMADQSNGVFVLNNLKVETGEWKIRVNNDWTGIDWGGTGVAGELTYSGDNIAVSKGEYNLTVDILNDTYTIEEAPFKTSPYIAHWVKDQYAPNMFNFNDKVYRFTDYWDGSRPVFYLGEFNKHGIADRKGGDIPLENFTDGDGFSIRYMDQDGLGNSYILGTLRGQVTINGTTYSPDSLSNDMVLMKFDTDLNITDIRHYAAAANVDPTGLAVNDAGEVFMSFWFESDFTFSGVNMLTAEDNHALAKLNSSLNYSAHRYGYYSYGMELSSDQTSIFTSAGTTISAVKISAVDLSVEQEFDLPDVNMHSHLSRMALTSDGDLIVVARIEVSSSGQTDILIGRQDGTTGDWEWYETVGGTANDGDQLFLELGSDDAIYLGTSFFGTWSWNSESLNSQGGQDFILTKYSPTGQQLWLETFGSTLDDNIYSMTVVGQDVYMGGYMQGAGSSFADVTLANEQNYFARLSDQPRFDAGALAPVNAYGYSDPETDGFYVNAFDAQTTDQLTVEMLFRLDSYQDGDWRSLITSEFWNMQINASGDTDFFEFHLGDGDTGSDDYWIGMPIGDAGLDDGGWHHLALTYDGTFFRGYVDGNPVLSQTATWTNPGTTFMGVASGVGGAVDELRIWSDVRSVEELRDLGRTELTGTETGLVGYWQFNAETDLGGGSFAVQDITANDQDLLFDPSVASITEDLTTPQIASIHSVNFQGFTVDWDEVGAATSYGVEVATDESFANVVVNETTSDLTYTVGGLTAETGYYVHVSASNSSETSPYSDFELVTTTAFEYGSTSDSLALVALYNSTNGSTWINAWDLTQPMDTWYGVTLDANRRVTELALNENNLVGTLPSELTNLSELQSLVVNTNTISGEIPINIDELTQLTTLNLGGNGFTGTIPASIGNLSGLTSLYLWGNSLSGSIPVELGSLSNLTEMNLQSAGLDGTLPVELGNLTNLTLLALGGNDFSGNIPSELGNLTQLTLLYIWGSNLSGSLPVELGNLTSLISLSLSQNNLNGDIPAEFSNLINLELLYLHDNYFTGVPDLTGLPLSTDGLYIHRNKIGFTDVQTNLPLLDNSVTFLYDPQYADDSVSLEPTVGEAVTLTTSELAAGTSYQWYKDDEVIDGATSSSYSFTFAAANEGVYTLEMTNSNVADLTIYRRPYFISDGVNENPADIELSNTIVDEGLAVGTLVGRLSTIDDPGDTHTYSLVDGTGGEDNSSFAIDGDRLVTNAVFDYDVDQTLNVLIQTDDGIGGVFSKSFVIEVKPVMECLDEVFTASSGTFSDGSLEYDYDNNFSCSWLIELAVGEQIVLGFNSFDTESGYDFVRIYDGSTTSATLLDELSGNTLPGEYTSTGNTMLVTFNSDGLVTAAGWEAYYYQLGGGSAPLIEDLNYPESVDVANTDVVTISAGIIDPDGNDIQEAFLFYSGARQDVYNSGQPVAGNLTNGRFEFQVSTDAFDLLGLAFYIYAFDGDQESETNVLSISNSLSTDNSSIGSINVSRGSTETSYRIISSPLKSVRVSDVFSDLNGQGKDVWRLLRYNGTSNTELSSSSNLEAGKGYWFLNTQQTSFSIPSGETVAANFDNPFEIPLNSNWNQIGNPYPYAIDWNEVLAVNGISSSMNVYNGGWSTTSTLNVFEGGFFENVDGLTSLVIPVTAISSARVQTRSNVTVNEGILGSDNWSFGLKAADAQLSYNVTQIGMNQNSRTGFDKNDAHVLPRLPEYLDIEFAENLTKEIVASGDYHKWEFNVNSTTGGKVTLSWDNLPLQGSTYGLLLWDVDNQQLVDLSQTNDYSFKASGVSTSFEMYYGRKDELLTKINLNADLMSNPYPNPFDSEFVVPVATKSESSDLNISILDLSGREVLSQNHKGLSEGFHEFRIHPGQNGGLDFRSGTYLLRVEVVTTTYSKVFNKRVVYIR